MHTLLKMADVAERLDVTESTILTWIKTAGFPAGRRLGGPRSRRVWLESDLDAWISRPVPAAKTVKRAAGASLVS